MMKLKPQLLVALLVFTLSSFASTISSETSFVAPSQVFDAVPVQVFMDDNSFLPTSSQTEDRRDDLPIFENVSIVSETDLFQNDPLAGRPIPPPPRSTPEPGTIFLLGSGLVGVAAFKLKTQKIKV